MDWSASNNWQILHMDSKPTHIKLYSLLEHHHDWLKQTPANYCKSSRKCKPNEYKYRSRWVAYRIDKVLPWCVEFASIPVLFLHSQILWIGRQICFGEKSTPNALVKLKSFQWVPHLNNYNYIVIDLMVNHLDVVRSTVLRSFYLQYKIFLSVS